MVYYSGKLFFSFLNVPGPGRNRVEPSKKDRGQCRVEPSTLSDTDIGTPIILLLAELLEAKA